MFDTTLSRVRKSEFFAILAPGFYAISALFLVTLAWHYAADNVPWWRHTADFLSKYFDRWPVPAAGAFFAYLIGCVLRAIPVSIADNLCGKVFKIIAREGYETDLYSGEFPYCTMLEGQLKVLQVNGVETGIEVPSCERSAHTMFNYWKATLCQFAQESFVLTQELEGQVRLFAGMFWSGVVGFSAIVAGVVFVPGLVSSTWFTPLSVYGLLSLTVGVVFGWRLRRVRGDEVRGVFLALAAFHDGSPMRPVEPALTSASKKRDHLKPLMG